METLQFLREQNVSEALIKEVIKFREQYPTPEHLKNRVLVPQLPFYGKEILEMAIAALLKGENLLLCGSKATGKNILAENLAYVFGRPTYNISFHVNTDSSTLIGTDTFRNNEVVLRKGPVYECAEQGGFGIFDEINMAKNDAVSVLHATLDYRRMIDVPGYDQIRLHEAARFIGTMNYGYAGTKELNEALVSRFLVINMPPLTEETLLFILKRTFPNAKEEALQQFTGLFLDLQLKAQNSEISTKPLDLRGLMGAIRTMEAGLAPAAAIAMGVTNKSFDIFEREMIEDIVMTRIPDTWSCADVFLEDELMNEKIEYEDEQTLEIENRMKNLLWTVSGDYHLNVKLDIQSFRKSKYISIYDAVKQGAFARYFDKEALGMYLVKKLYFGADEPALTGIAQLAVDCAVCERMSQERKGVASIRRKAFSDMLDYDFGKMSASIVGRIKLELLRGVLTGERKTDAETEQVLTRLRGLNKAGTTYEVLEVIDWIYNRIMDRRFEEKYGNLEKVLAVTMEELREFDWQDFLDEELSEEQLQAYVNQVSQAVTSMQEQQKKEEKPRRQGMSTVILNEEAIAKMYSYMELNYGRSYLSELEQKRINYQVCRGAHADCSLYFTDGILSNMVKKNYQSEYARRAKEENLRVYNQHYRMSRRNIGILTDALRRSLLQRSEREEIVSEYGKILPQKLWKVGRTSDTKLFSREIKKDNSDFVVDVLIDASGSQRSRQSLVALQGFILSEALSNVGIPHRVMGFCTFWDYTVMHRFREYDESREANKRIFEFHSSSNNRDGLAIRAAAYELEKREEEHKVLIVLSDGRPNDIIVNRPNSRNPEPYFGDYAVKDTAAEVRKLRAQDISVLGVFAGEEQDLAAEQKIFGKDFAYIRNISNFSNVVGLYLRKQLDE